MSTLTLESILNPEPVKTERRISPEQAAALQFTDFAISDSLKQRLGAAGFVKPTPVQAGAIPPALEGDDILATASTGTGKTLSFLIPMIERLEEISVPSNKGKKNPVLALILLPTRELAMQVLEHYHNICPQLKNDAVLVCGGLNENPQIEALQRGPRIVVATPGRLEDYLDRRKVKLNEVDMLVLDEVDRMLDMGFLPAIRRIVGALPKDRQTMCYSATLDANIRNIVRDYVHEPVRIEIGTTSKPSDRVTLRVVTVMQDQKLAQLDRMLNEEEGSYLVFSRTKHGADRIGKKLEKLGHKTEIIHGDRSQSQRTTALKRFADGKARILVATDVAARGIDISHIAHVVNYDLPNGSDDFVHRIGRTGRAGAKGIATTFVTPLEKRDAKKLEKELKIEFEWLVADKDLAKEERNTPIDLAKQSGYRHGLAPRARNPLVEERLRRRAPAAAARARSRQARPRALRSASRWPPQINICGPQLWPSSPPRLTHTTSTPNIDGASAVHSRHLFYASPARHVLRCCSARVSSACPDLPPKGHPHTRR